MLDAVDADLRVARLDGEAVAAFDGDVVGEVGPRHRQLVGEDDADARIGDVGVDRVGEDAEAVLGEHLVVFGADVAVLGDRRLAR